MSNRSGKTLKIMNILNLVKMIFISLLVNETSTEKEPVRLHKKVESEKKPRKKKIIRFTPELLLIIIVIALMIIIPLLVYSSGCLESTTLYNGRLI